MTSAGRATYFQALGTNAPANLFRLSGHRRARDLGGDATLKVRKLHRPNESDKYEEDPVDDRVKTAELDVAESEAESEIVEEHDDDDTSEDSEAELLRELQRIKAERAVERKNEESRVMAANPLIGGISRRWDEDTVFRAQAPKNESKNSFVNDAVRSDFHRKFLNKYIQ